MENLSDTGICVMGIDFVGLPMTRLFSTKFDTKGFDMSQVCVDALMKRGDTTLELSDGLLQDAISNYGLRCTTNLEGIELSLSVDYDVCVLASAHKEFLEDDTCSLAKDGVVV